MRRHDVRQAWLRPTAWRSVALAVVLAGVGSTAAAAEEATAANAGLLGHWPMDDGAGRVVTDRGPHRRHGRMVNATWATGAFGTAARTTARNSQVLLPPCPELDGAAAMTLALWVTWEGTGQYPNIVTAGWSPGGFMIFINRDTAAFRLGRPGHSARDPNHQWREHATAMLSALPRQRWTHLAVTFSRPQVTTYVDGRRVATSTWDEPIGTSDPIVLGQWNTAESHQGLLSDFRLYGRALAPAEIAQLAEPGARRRGCDYQVVTTGLEAQTILTLESRCATLAIGDQGAIVSLRQKGPEPRELLDGPVPLFLLTLASGAQLPSTALRLEDGLLVSDFPGGSARVRVSAPGEYFRFTAEAMTVPGVTRWAFLQAMPSCQTYVGRMAGVLSDDASGVCLRSLGLGVDVVALPAPSRMQAIASAEHGLTGHSAALAAGPRDELRTMLQAMAVAEGVPHSRHGGPWATDSDLTRLSYLFVHEGFNRVDEWIDLAHRGAFGIVHFREPWYTTLGTYTPAARFFPRGLEDMVAAAERIHAAGLKLGLHTLTGCINPTDPLVTPEAPADLIPAATYTLARPLEPGDTEVVIAEPPGTDHDLVWTYSGRGNALRIGTEILRYSAISRTPPYAFTGCERGAFKTRPAASPAGTRVDYLQQRYIAFYPQPDSALAQTVAENIARVYNACQADFIYLDGSEGMGSRYAIDAMRWAIFSRLHGGMSEASCHGHNNWWFHSRLGAWDSALWGLKRFHDRHIESARQHRLAELLEPQLGWWALNGASPHARGQFPDETEYFAARNLALDASMSIGGVRLSVPSPNGRVLEMLTLLGWYERLRLARYFDDETLRRLDQPGQEVRLRLNPQGHWRLTPVAFAEHRITGLGNGSESWTVTNPHAAQPLRLRLEALYTVAPATGPTPPAVLLDIARIDQLDIRRSATGVTQELSVVTTDTRGAPENLRIVARNANRSRRGAWTRLGQSFPFPYHSLSQRRGLGLWVRGDGSGAVLNVQLETPPEYSATQADHYIDLDFTGWRYVELLLRERDAARMADYAWPYAPGAHSNGQFRRALDVDHLATVSLWLNEIPGGGAVDITVGPLWSLPVRRVALRDPELTVNGQRLRLPVAMASGDVVEMESPSEAVHVSERGDLIARLTPVWPDGPIQLAAGPNSIDLAATGLDGLSVRAAVTAITLGEPFGRRAATGIDWGRLRREYALPEIVTLDRGQTAHWTLVGRDEEGASPSDEAALEVAVTLEKTGTAQANAADPAARVLDDATDPAAFKPSEHNDYARFAFDAENQGTAKPGVSFELQPEEGPDGSRARRFLATSSRADGRGWAAVGRRLQTPVTIAGVDALACWIRGDGQGHSFKIQLRDSNGAHHDSTLTIDFSGWRFVEFPLSPGAIDLSRIEYVLYYYNNLAPGARVDGGIGALRASRAAQVVNGVTLTLNGDACHIPTQLAVGETITCRQDRWIRTDAQGQRLADGRLQAPLLSLRTGPNDLALAFTDTGAAETCRATVRCVTVYP